MTITTMTVSSSVEAWRLRDADLCGLVAWHMYGTLIYLFIYSSTHYFHSHTRATKGTMAVGQGDGIPGRGSSHGLFEASRRTVRELPWLSTPV